LEALLRKRKNVQKENKKEFHRLVKNKNCIALINSVFDSHQKQKGVAKSSAASSIMLLLIIHQSSPSLKKSSSSIGGGVHFISIAH
jgi:hypothetical protein